MIPTREELVKLYDKEHMRDQDVGIVYGRSRTQVRRWKRKYGLKGHRACLHIRTLRLPQEEWKYAYLAGIIDGEGSIFVDKQGNRGRSVETKISTVSEPGCRPGLSICNTDLSLMEWLVANFGGKFWAQNKRHRERTNLGKLLCYYWAVNPILELTLLLPRLIPYLVIKKNKAILALSFCENRLKEHGYDLKNMPEVMP